MAPSALGSAYLLRLGSAFSASRVLLSAVELDIFSLLQTPHTAEQIRLALDLHPRSVPDFPDSLVALNVLHRLGDGPSALYSNTPDADTYLVKSSPRYLGGYFEFCGRVFYQMWANLTDSLKNGQPQFQIQKKYGSQGEDMWENLLGGDNAEIFVNGVSGIYTPGHREFARKFDFSACEVFLDLGGAAAQCSCEVAMQNKHVKCINFDQLVVEKFAVDNVRKHGMEERVSIRSGDFWTDDLGMADVIMLSAVLHDWDEEQRRKLMRRAYDALSAEGRLVVVEAMIDDERKESLHGLLMSLGMLVATDCGSNFSARDVDVMAKDVGFMRTEEMTLDYPIDALIAYKP